MKTEELEAIAYQFFPNDPEDRDLSEVNEVRRWKLVEALVSAYNKGVEDSAVRLEEVGGYGSKISEIKEDLELLKIRD